MKTMTTKELIEKAKHTAFGNFNNSETLNLFVELVDRLEMEHEMLKNLKGCSSCKHLYGWSGECNECERFSKFEWVGDV